jgi:uncharacterized protein DUF5681
MAEGSDDYKVGPGRPPLHTRFKKGRSGNPSGVRRAKPLPALLVEKLDEKLVVTIDGRRRRITKREAMIARLVDKSAAADLGALKLLLDMQKGAEEKAASARSAPEAALDEADEKVIATLLHRLALADAQREQAEQAATPPDGAADG